MRPSAFAPPACRRPPRSRKPYPTRGAARVLGGNLAAPWLFAVATTTAARGRTASSDVVPQAARAELGYLAAANPHLLGFPPVLS